jgi:hypothetical protein
MGDMKLYVGGRKVVRQCKQIIAWIGIIKSGKESLIIGREYIVMSKKSFDKLNNRIKELENE